MNIEELGFSKEDVLQKVADQIAKQVLSTIGYDDEGEFEDNTRYLNSLNKSVQEKLDAAIIDIADNHVLPNINTRIEKYTLQKTNQWGESIGEEMTFVEYLINRAEAWMNEPVNFEGKPKDTGSSYSWKSNQARVAWMIDKHLQYSISRAMESAIKSANNSIIDGLKKTIDIQLSQIHKKLKIDVKV